jgi:type IV secretory pathway VirJ component
MWADKNSFEDDPLILALAAMVRKALEKEQSGSAQSSADDVIIATGGDGEWQDLDTEVA